MLSATRAGWLDVYPRPKMRNRAIRSLPDQNG